MPQRNTKSSAIANFLVTIYTFLYINEQDWDSFIIQRIVSLQKRKEVITFAKSHQS